MRFLISNSVPLNGGDEALLRGLILALKGRVEGASVTTLCKNVGLCRELLPDLELGSDLEFSESPMEFSATRKLYRRADAVLSAPGGFFHDHYAIELRLRGLEVALAMGKPVFLCGQSVGPFWKPESIARVREVFNRVTQIFVRDELSYRYLMEAGVAAERVTVITDLAFLWRGLGPELFRSRVYAGGLSDGFGCSTSSGGSTRHLLPPSPPPGEGKGLNVGVCIRPWPLKDKVSIEATVEKCVGLVRRLLDDSNTRVTFISTCQGVAGYWDDSALAIEVVTRLSAAEAGRCVVDRVRREPRELIRALGALDGFIGMRLHGCLLAMLGGTPALGLGYEPKTAEIFGQMGLSEWQLPFTESGGKWVEAAERFLPRLGELHFSLPGKLDEMGRRAERAVDGIVQMIQTKAAVAA